MGLLCILKCHWMCHLNGILFGDSYDFLWILYDMCIISYVFLWILYDMCIIDYNCIWPRCLCWTDYLWSPLHKCLKNQGAGTDVVSTYESSNPRLAILSCGLSVPELLPKTCSTFDHVWPRFPQWLSDLGTQPKLESKGCAWFIALWHISCLGVPSGELT